MAQPVVRQNRAPLKRPVKYLALAKKADLNAKATGVRKQVTLKGRKEISARISNPELMHVGKVVTLLRSKTNIMFSLAEKALAGRDINFDIEKLAREFYDSGISVNEFEEYGRVFFLQPLTSRPDLSLKVTQIIKSIVNWYDYLEQHKKK